MRRRGRARIVPGRWTESEFLVGGTTAQDPSELRGRLRPAGARMIEPGDILLFGPGVGAGTMTDSAATALARAGAGAVLSSSADQAFRDACLHAGLPILLVAGLTGAVGDGDDLTVDFAAGTIEDVTRRRMLVATPLSSAELRLVRTAPSLAWYGIVPGEPDPDVVETIAVPPNDY